MTSLNARVSSRQHFRGLRGKGFPTDSRTNCAPLLADIFLLLIRSVIHTVFALNWKKIASQLNFTYRYIDDVLSINNPDFENFLGQMYPTELEIKRRRRATPLLPTWINSCRSRVTVSSALYDVTISTSISQTFRSWVAIFHLRQPMVFLSHSSYGIQGLHLLWMFYSKGSATFI